MGKLKRQDGITLIAAAVFLLLFGLALVFIAPKVSLFARSFPQDSVNYHTLRQGDSMTASFTVPCDRLKEISVDIEGVEEDQRVAFLDADVTIEDMSGNTVYMHKMNSVYEETFDVSGAGLSRGSRYTFRIKFERCGTDDCTVRVGTASDGSIALTMKGLYNGAPAKGMFTGLYAALSVIFLWFLFSLKEKDPSKTKLADTILLGAAVFVAVIAVNQFYDLFMTAKAALRLIDSIKAGKFFGFYDYAYGNELNIQSVRMFFGYNYNVLLLLPVAILLLPFSFFCNGDIGYSVMGNLIVLYLDVAVAALVILSYRFVDRIGRVCGMPEDYIRSVRYMYAFSPAILFVSVAFGQVDIIYVLIILLALPYYLGKRYRMFALLMSVAVAMKLLPLLIFIPLILLARKKIKDIAVDTGICLSITVLTKLIFERGSGYASISNIINERYGFTETLFDARIGGNLILFVLGYVAVCVFCYMKDTDPGDRQGNLFYTMLTIFAVYAVFTSFVDWHPQWMIPLYMAAAFLIPYSGSDGRLLVLEAVSELILIIATALKSTGIIMVEYGMLASSDYQYSGADINGILENVTPSYYAVVTTLNAAVLLLLVFFFVRKGRTLKRSGNSDGAMFRVSRGAAAGRVFILFSVLLSFLWCYCYIG